MGRFRSCQRCRTSMVVGSPSSEASNVISVDFESMVVVERHNESDVLTLLHEITPGSYSYFFLPSSCFGRPSHVCTGARILCEGGPHGVT